MLSVNKTQDLVVSDNDIHVYKCFLENRRTGQIMTSFCRLKMDDVNCGTIIVDNNDIERYESIDGKHDEIKRGVFHSFLTLDKCDDFGHSCEVLSELMKNEGDEWIEPVKSVVFEMTIPKGTPYIIADNGYHVGSKKLQFIKKL